MIPEQFDAVEGDSHFDERFSCKERNTWLKLLPAGDRGFIYQNTFRKAEFNSRYTERKE